MESLKAYLASFPDYPGYLKVAMTDPFGNVVVQYVLADTIFWEMVTYLAVVPTAPPAMVEPQAQENGPTQEELEAGDAFEAHVEVLNRAKSIVEEFDGDLTLQPVEIRIINDLKKALTADNAEKLKEALQDWDVLAEFDEDEERVREEQAHVAQLLSEDDEDETRKAQLLKDKKKKAKELFVEANKLFQIQKALFQEKKPRAELHAAQEAYIRIIDELRALMAEIDEPTFTLRAMADERWPEENHDDFEQKLKIIYESIKSKVAHYNRKPGVVRKPVVGKPAPAAATLADILSAQLAKEAAGGGNA